MHPAQTSSYTEGSGFTGIFSEYDTSRTLWHGPSIARSFILRPNARPNASGS